MAIPTSVRGFFTFFVLALVFATSYIAFNYSIDPSYLSFARNETPKPFNIQIKDITNNSANINWNTKQLMIGKILISTNPDDCTTAKISNECIEVADGSAITSNHVVHLKNLKSGTKYYFFIKINESVFPANGAINFVTFSE